MPVEEEEVVVVQQVASIVRSSDEGSRWSGRRVVQ